MKTFGTILCAATVAFALSRSSEATVITYDLTNLSANTWEYDYHVGNDTLSSDIEEFSVYFDFSSYANLMVTTPLSPAWDEIVVQPDTGIPDDGFFDALVALGPSIAPGTTQSGFSVKFDWLGAGTPGAQFFQVVDAITFDVLDEGFTAPAPASVPEPCAFLLALAGIAVVAVRRRRTASWN
jgi:hypothetical protein